MKIRCGKDLIDVTKVKEISVYNSIEDWSWFEEQQNGKHPGSKGYEATEQINSINTEELRKQIEVILNENWSVFAAKLRKNQPQLAKSEDEEYIPSCFRNCRYSSSSFLVTPFDDVGDAYVYWEFAAKFYSESGNYIESKGKKTLTLRHSIIPIWEELAEKAPKKKKSDLHTVLKIAEFMLHPLECLLADDEKTDSDTTDFEEFAENAGKIKAWYAEIANVLNVYRAIFSSEIAPSEGRIAKREAFLNAHNGEYYLFIKMARSRKLYPQKSCDFDIFEKYDELDEAIKRHKQKEENSTNPGEQAVEYAIKWFMASGQSNIVAVEANCESQHRYNCIQLFNPDFIDEPQEYDHILVCSAGVIIIETKHWKGTVDIRPDGQWTRKKDPDGSFEGEKSPKFQMRRHEALMQSILPNIRIHSILCFSNPTIMIDGRENFQDYPIDLIDQ